MKKLAIFVEGQTERIFVEQLLTEIAGWRNIKIVSRKCSGGGKAEKKIGILQYAGAIDPTLYVMLTDCGSDKHVASEIKSSLAGLEEAGYSAVIGIRDVYPKFSHDEVPRLRTGMKIVIPESPVVVDFILGVMEVESWFLSEHSHFVRIDPKLGPEKILEELGFDPRTDDMQSRPNPAKDLHEAYNIVGKGYTKALANIKRTTDALNYESLYIEIRTKVPDLDRLMAIVDSLLVELTA